jgi:hypothetical protein
MVSIMTLIEDLDGRLRALRVCLRPDQLRITRQTVMPVLAVREFSATAA